VQHYFKENKMNKILITIIGTACLLGCNKTEQGASFGAGIGALAGQAIGGDTESTLIGAGVGALLGGAIGNDQENQPQSQIQNGTTRRQSQTTRRLNPDGTYTVTGHETTSSEQTEDGYVGLPQ